MNFLVWRHADAAPGEPDALRALTPLGIQQAQFIGTWIKKNVPGPYRIFGSSALRASQTASYLGEPYDPIDDFGYMKDSATGSAVLQHANWPLANSTTIFVGHQPTVGRINSILHGDIEKDTNMEGGSLWWFTSDHDNKNRLAMLKAVISANGDASINTSFCKV
jgi:phosphohistidine phosphatase